MLARLSVLGPRPTVHRMTYKHLFVRASRAAARRHSGASHTGTMLAQPRTHVGVEPQRGRARERAHGALRHGARAPRFLICWDELSHVRHASTQISALVWSMAVVIDASTSRTELELPLILLCHLHRCMVPVLLGRTVRLTIAACVERELLPFQGAERHRPRKASFFPLPPLLANAEVCQLPAEGIRALQCLALLHDVVDCVELFVRVPSAASRTRARAECAAAVHVRGRHAHTARAGRSRPAALLVPHAAARRQCSAGYNPFAAHESRCTWGVRVGSRRANATSTNAGRRPPGMPACARRARLSAAAVTCVAFSTTVSSVQSTSRCAGSEACSSLLIESGSHSSISSALVSSPPPRPGFGRSFECWFPMLNRPESFSPASHASCAPVDACKASQP